MAPRVHNSGHWTIERARTSQFEKHIRAVCGLPMGAVDLVASRVDMVTLSAGDAHDCLTTLPDPNAHLHHYGKGAARPDSNMRTEHPQYTTTQAPHPVTPTTDNRAAIAADQT